jgi:hypothetical protein
MIKYTFTELSKKHPEYTSWGCDGRSLKPCVNKEKIFSDPYEYLYHDAKVDADFCEACVKLYKAT